MYKKIRKHYIFNMFKNIKELFSKVKGLLFFVVVFCDLLFHVWLRRQSNMAFINKEDEEVRWIWQQMQPTNQVRHVCRHPWSNMTVGEYYLGKQFIIIMQIYLIGLLDKY